LAVLTWLGIIQIWHIYILTAIQAVATSFDGPAANPGAKPGPARGAASAFSLQSIASNTGSIVGPGLAGS